MKLRWATEEKDKLDAKMSDAIENARQKERHILDQEEQIRAFQEEIRNMKQQIEDKKEEIQRLKAELKRLNDEIEMLEEELDRLNRRIAQLERAIAEKEDELNRLGAILHDKDLLFDKLTRELGEEPPQLERYKAQKGDLVDEMLAQYINVANCPVPIKRLGGGFYLFGLRKIFAKIMNGKLVIRVGGGYMVIEEFISSYADQELIKLEKIAIREGVRSFEDLDLEAIALGGGSRGATAGSPRNSPKNTTKSPRSSRHQNVNGSSRQKTLTAAQIKNARSQKM